MNLGLMRNSFSAYVLAQAKENRATYHICILIIILLFSKFMCHAHYWKRESLLEENIGVA